MKIVVFDIWGDLGHFRVPYTTSSPLTFPIPPKTAIYGMIGAILGYDKDNCLENFQNKRWEIAIGIKNKIVTTRIPENFINTKEVKLFARMPKGKLCRTQINMEFLKEPYFRIYVASREEIELKRLENYLIEHRSKYTVSLGISECLANFKYIGTFSAEKVSNNNFVEISSIIPLNYLENDSNRIDFLQEGAKYLRIHIPVEMKPDRELIESEDFIVEVTGKTVKVKLNNYLTIQELNENIILF